MQPITRAGAFRGLPEAGAARAGSVIQDAGDRLVAADPGRAGSGRRSRLCWPWPRPRRRSLLRPRPRGAPDPGRADRGDRGHARRHLGERAVAVLRRCARWPACPWRPRPARRWAGPSPRSTSSVWSPSSWSPSLRSGSAGWPTMVHLRLPGAGRASSSRCSRTRPAATAVPGRCHRGRVDMGRAAAADRPARQPAGAAAAHRRCAARPCPCGDLGDAGRPRGTRRGRAPAPAARPAGAAVRDRAADGRPAGRPAGGSCRSAARSGAPVGGRHRDRHGRGRCRRARPGATQGPATGPAGSATSAACCGRWGGASASRRTSGSPRWSRRPGRRLPGYDDSRGPPQTCSTWWSSGAPQSWTTRPRTAPTAADPLDESEDASAFEPVITLFSGNLPGSARARWPPARSRRARVGRGGRRHG